MYKLVGNNIEVELDTNTYNLSSIKKALYNFCNDRIIDMKFVDESKIHILISLKKDENSDDLIKKIYEELFNESLRYDVMLQTKNIRELIIGRALYSTCIDTESDSNSAKEEFNEKEYSIDKIAKDWFEVNKN
ncbi:MAG: hypothetical protein J6A15_08465 [Clostridia bacterium]|nr:hypothetical protein [Clostridia bacterium]